MQFNYCKGIAHFVLLLIRVCYFNTKIVESSEIVEGGKACNKMEFVGKFAVLNIIPSATLGFYKCMCIFHLIL